MKIVFVNSSLQSGGTERALSGYANYLCNFNDITIIKLDSEPSFYKLDDRIKLINLGLIAKSSSFIEAVFNNLKRIYILKKIFYKLSPDIVFSFQTQTNILSIIAAKISGLKIMAFEQINHLYEKSMAFIVLRRILYPMLDKLFVLTRFDQDYYGGFVKKVVKIPNAVFVKFPEKNEFEKKEKIILAVGRFHEDKQFDVLIKIFSRIDRQGYKLLIAGDGPIKDRCKKLVDELILSDSVFILEKTSEIEKLYSRARIFCLTSLMEGFPNVLIEAMSFGCVPVAFDCLTGPSDIITDSFDGFLIKDFNENKFAEKLSYLINNEDILRKMSEKSFDSAKRFYPEKILKYLESELV